MSLMQLVAETLSRGRPSRGNQRNVSGTLDGAMYTAHYALAMALEGRVFVASTGSATTPVTFKTGYTAAQPELVIDVPSGTAIIPVTIQVYAETSAGTINEIVAVTGTNNVGAGTSTAVTQTSTRTDRPVTSGASVYSLYSGNGTAPTGVTEFWRSGYAFADATGNPIKKFEWNYNAADPQVIVGVGCLALYIGGTTSAQTGFAKVSWIELPGSGI